ncbi:MAG TPA: hypothetical protein VF930_06900 [Stellaceae bacterium]
MLVSVGDISARCKSCGGIDFKVLSAGALHLSSALVCTHCGRETTYLDLLDSIGEEAMRQANEAVAKLKKDAARGPKSKK